ncbi:MAG: 3-deoxy-manno-octulosonate cytidylyltransferase [Desulfonatronovibrio sp.]
MSTKQKFIGIIPVRYKSTRFPGKPLADILGKPMFEHVYRRAVKCGLLDHVCLATDDARIFDAARESGIPVVMTSNEHKSGSDRVLEAARILNAAEDSIIVNIQGDEPLLEPGMLDQLLAPFISNPEINISTLARPISFDEAENINIVKVVFSQSGKALYFSRNLIPYSSDKSAVHAHIGLYAFRLKYLDHFSGLDQGRLEKLESLEQLRLLEADIPIHVVLTEHSSHGVDTPEDIKNVIKIMQEKNNESNSST